MRYLKYFFLLLSACSSLQACQKESIHPEATNTSLTGNWQWASSIGGITGQDEQTPEGTKTNIHIQFTSDNRFLRYENGVKTQETTYILQKGESIYSATGSSDLISIENSGIRYSYRLENNQLYLFDECYDCYTHHYVRIAK